MLLANDKPICLIGFEQSTITQEAYFFLSQEFTGRFVTISPDEFLALDNKQQYQYFVAFTLDVRKRMDVIDVIESMNLDCIRYMHDTCVCYTKDPTEILGHGSFVSPFSTLLRDSHVGRHCIIETYCLLSHYSTLGDNVILHSGTLIAGKTIIGANSVFNFKSGALNGLTICGDIEVGGSSTITKSIELPGYYVGSPARRLGDRPQENF